MVVDFLAGFITMLSVYRYINGRFGLERDLFRIDNFYLERERGLRCSGSVRESREGTTRKDGRSGGAVKTWLR